MPAAPVLPTTQNAGDLGFNIKDDMNTNTTTQRNVYHAPKLFQTLIITSRVYAASNWNNAEIEGEFQDLYGGEL